MLKLNPSVIDKIVISHEHGDHTGGLRSVLKEVKQGVSVYLPNDFDAGLKNDFPGIEFKVNDKFTPVQNNIWATTVFKNQENKIQEQALVIEKEDGIIIITGCAHPGIEEMCRSICEFFKGKQPELVTGGFHLMSMTPGRVKQISGKIRELGIKHIAPSHCTGENSIAIFNAEWKDGFVPLNLGDTYYF